MNVGRAQIVVLVAVMMMMAVVMGMAMVVVVMMVVVMIVAMLEQRRAGQIDRQANDRDQRRLAEMDPHRLQQPKPGFHPDPERDDQWRVQQVVFEIPPPVWP